MYLFSLILLISIFRTQVHENLSELENPDYGLGHWSESGTSARVCCLSVFGFCFIDILVIVLTLLLLHLLRTPFGSRINVFLPAKTKSRSIWH
jgi:hypothetical protein